MTRNTVGVEQELGDRALLRIHGVVREFGGVRAVDEADLKVPSGRLVGLIGPNGAGKSTLVSIAAGSLEPTAGKVEFDGEDVTGWPSYRLAQRGLIRTFQIPGEFSSLTVMDNLLTASLDGRDSFWRALTGRRTWASKEDQGIGRARDLMQRFGMSHTENQIAANLSAGQKRLLEIMRALMANPTLLLMDEPFSGVTPPIVEVIGEQLLRVRDDGVTVVIVEHDLKVIETLCDLVVVMAGGQVIATGTMREVREDERVRDAYLV